MDFSYAVFVKPRTRLTHFDLDDFEVSIFLTETSTRHSLLTKQKHFHDKSKGGLQSNSDKLTGLGNTSEEAIHVEDAGTDAGAPIIRREESDDDMIGLQDIPPAEADNERGRRRRPKRARSQDSDEDYTDGLFVDDEEEQPLRKRMKETTLGDTDGGDDKKKMAMNTSYDGFSIYGRVLCLVVKRRDNGKAKGGVSGGQAMMEDWITSTQMPAGDEDGI